MPWSLTVPVSETGGAAAVVELLDSLSSSSPHADVRRATDRSTIVRIPILRMSNDTADAGARIGAILGRPAVVPSQ